MFNKLFTKILDSSIWLEPTPTRIVWITLLAAMDQDGYAHFSAIENLAARARVTVDEAQKAVECFLAPDPNSANPANEGRRIERVPGGFFVLNAAEHRATINREFQREQTRERVRRFREKGSSNVTTDGVTSSLPIVTPASASEPAFDPVEKIYAEYPRKVAKQDALKAIRKALDSIEFDALFSATRSFKEAVARWPEGKQQFIPYPATWFNSARYNDDPKEWAVASEKPKSVMSTLKFLNT